jgi:predicted Zn-dependent peptidase
MRYLQKIIDRPETYLVYLPQKTKNVYIDVFVRTGRLHEPDEQVGIGHVMDHYVNGSLYAKYLDRLNTNAWISQEHLHFHLSTNESQALRDAARFLDTVFGPKFTNDELFMFERQSIVNELKSEFASVGSRQAQLVAENRFVASSPYARSVLTEADNVLRITLKDLENYHRQFFVRGNITVFIAAHKPRRSFVSKVFHLVKSYDLAEGEGTPYPANRYSGFRVASYPDHDVAGQQYVSLSFPGLSYENSVEERIALNLFCRVLTGMSRHSIFSPLRRSGIYAIDYSNIYYCHFGLVSFSAAIPPTRLKQFVGILSRALHTFKVTPLSRNFLQIRLKGVRERTRNAWKNNNDLYNWIMEYILDEGSVRTPKEVFASLNKITPEFIQALAGRVFQKNQANLVISGEKPTESRAEIASWLDF